jgi:hypothetical protein
MAHVKDALVFRLELLMPPLWWGCCDDGPGHDICRWTGGRCWLRLIKTIVVAKRIDVAKWNMHRMRQI